MTPDDKRAAEKGEAEIDPLAGIEEAGGKGEGEAGSNRADGDGAGDEDEKGPDGEDDKEGPGHEGGEDAAGGGDALAALEAEPGREVVAEDGGEAAEDEEERDGPAGVVGKFEIAHEEERGESP